MNTVTTIAPMSPLRRRMQQDKMMGGLGPHNQHDCIRHVRRFAAFLRRPPDTATREDIRRIQIHAHKSGLGPARTNGTVSALRFFFTVTLRRRDLAGAGPCAVNTRCARC
jgi:hypothetical protein